MRLLFFPIKWERPSYQSRHHGSGRPTSAHRLAGAPLFGLAPWPTEDWDKDCAMVQMLSRTRRLLPGVWIAAALFALGSPGFPRRSRPHPNMSR